MMSDTRLLLTNAAIVDAALPEPRPGMQVLIEGDTIREVSDRPKGYAMSAGRTLLITESGSEVLSRLPVEYAVCREGGWGKARALG